MIVATLVALASVVIAAGPAFAHGSHGHGGQSGHGGQRLRSSVPTRVFPHQRFFHGHNARFGFSGGAPVIGYGDGIAYGAPEYVPPPPTYYPPSYSPSLSYTPPPMQTVIEFPSGRYVLQGDGITAPYRWVWVPNPPSDEPPATPPPPPAPAASEPAPVRHLDYYRWTDADGVTHLTDSIDRVPEQYRAQATKSTT